MFSVSSDSYFKGRKAKKHITFRITLVWIEILKIPNIKFITFFSFYNPVVPEFWVELGLLAEADHLLARCHS